jgi:hypothetical protein
MFQVRFEHHLRKCAAPYLRDLIAELQNVGVVGNAERRAVGAITGLALLPESKYWPISWAFNRDPLKWLPPLNPEDAPPPPPTMMQKVMKFVGLSGSSGAGSTAPISSTQASRNRRLAQKQKL